MGRKSENMGRSVKNMWRNSEKDGSRGIYSHGKIVIEATKDADFCPTKIGGEKQPLHCYTRRVHHEGFASRWDFTPQIYGYPSSKRLHSYNVRPPRYVCWFRFAPVTIVINTINHSYWSYVHQLSYLGGLTL